MTWEGGFREFRVFADSAVTVHGAAAAVMKPWDDDGHSEISYVELDTGAGPRAIHVARAAPSRNKYIVEQVTSVVALAEAEADVLDLQEVTRRFAELERKMDTWVQHLPGDEAERQRTRFRTAQSRAMSRVQVAEQASVAEHERIVSHLEELVSSPDWESASVRFDQLSAQWRDERLLRSSQHAVLEKRFNAARREARTKQSAAKAARAKALRIATKEQLIADLEALVVTTDWPAANKQYRKIKNRWRSTGHFKKSEEATLTDLFREAESAFLAAQTRALEAANRRREAKAREARVEGKKLLIADLERLSRTTDWQAADHEYQDVKRRWSQLGHFTDAEEASLSDAFASAEAVLAATLCERRDAAAREREIRDAEERLVKQKQVVIEAEALARAPYWEPQRFEALARRWKAATPVTEPELLRRFQDAYLLARGAGFKDAIRQRIQLADAIAAVTRLTEWIDRAQEFAAISHEWSMAAWTGPAIERPLEQRFKAAVNAFLDSCDATDLERSIAQVDEARLLAHAAGNGSKARDLEGELSLLRELEDAVLRRSGANKSPLT